MNAAPTSDSRARASVRKRKLSVRGILLATGGAIVCSLTCACATKDETGYEDVDSLRASEIVAVAPVLNLSNRNDWDPLKVTDWLSSELQSVGGVAVIPVNRTLAALQARGAGAVESADDAWNLAMALGADGVIVAAVTEFDPFDPPRIAWIMQWYDLRAPLRSPYAPNLASDGARIASRGGGSVLQVQRVFSASEKGVQNELKAYASQRSGHGSPYGWRVFGKSQELFVRYSCWSAIRSMQKQRNAGQVPAMESGW